MINNHPFFQKIMVIGAGYVGLSNAILLAQTTLDSRVTLVDIDEQKIQQLQQKQSPIQDELIQQYLINQPLNLQIQHLDNADFQSTDLVIIATPTNYEMATGKFDTSSVESCIRLVQQHNPVIPIVIKSTIPIGFSKQMQQDIANPLLFMPEFLREGQALYDNLYPSRIIVGSFSSTIVEQKLIELYQKASLSPDVPSCVMPTTEAEAVKLFANSYLATRIAFFNELDSFAESWGLDSRAIITGVGLDPRIGQHYNNPSFGYGGYCLPKDIQQLKANYVGIPANVIHAVIEANNTRKQFITQQIIAKNPQTIGIYRLSMKKNADNFRDSAVLDIIQMLKDKDFTIYIYEPNYQQSHFLGCSIKQSLEDFLTHSDIIVANRWHDELLSVQDKVYSRDIFGDS